MFDMEKESGENSGYQIRINYDKSTKIYGLAGYIVNQVGGRIQYQIDGGVLHFDKLEQVIEHLQAYEYK